MPAFYGRIPKIDPDLMVTVWESTRGKARAAIYNMARDSDFYDVKFTDVQIRSGQYLQGYSWDSLGRPRA